MTMRKYFTSQPDSYYSDALFFISLGLHKIADDQNYGIMIDVDTKIQIDVKLLFDEFNNFSKINFFFFYDFHFPLPSPTIPLPA